MKDEGDEHRSSRHRGRDHGCRGLMPGCEQNSVGPTKPRDVNQLGRKAESNHRPTYVQMTKL